MLAIIAPSFTDPSGYQISELPEPSVAHPKDVLVRVHAASVNPVDVKLAGGTFKQVLSELFPLQIGYDCAGVVIAVGSEVTKFKAGDEVYSRLPEVSKGSWSEQVKVSEQHLALKPASLSFSDAASLPLAALTALQALNKYEGSLEGKTVFVPAGLGGAGAFACQLAKNVFKAGKVITTVSTMKVAKVSELLGEGVVDKVIDYTKQDPTKIIAPASVDFMLDTLGQSMQYLHLMVPSTSKIVSISTTPSGPQMQNASFFKRPTNPRVPWLAYLFLSGSDHVRKLRASRWKVTYQYMFLESSGEELDVLTKYMDEGQVRPVVGSKTNLRDIEKVRQICMQVYQGKGGIGKAVFEVN